MSNLNIEKIEQFSELSEAEKEYALQILQEMSSTGVSQKFDDLLYSDYSEIPVDINTFVTDDRYLGIPWKNESGKSKMFPYWVKKLNELFPNNVDISVNNFIASGARGLGKSEIGVTCGLYIMYRVMCMKNPLEYFGLKPTEKICFAFMNITKDLSKDIGISKLQNTVQKSPWFMSHGIMTRKDNSPYWVPPAPIEVIVGSQSSHVIGKPILFAMFDEISFIRNRDIDKQKKIAIDMIDTALGGMMTRFVKHGKNPTLMYLASSKRSEKSFLEEHMKKKLENEKDNVIICDEAVWNVQPKGTFSSKCFKVALGNKFLPSSVIPDEDDPSAWKDRGYSIIDVPVDFRAKFLDDIERALCDYAGISSTEISKYISGQAVRDVINDTLSNPFTREIIETGNDPADTLQYADCFDLNKVPQGMLDRPLYVHLDMSISGDMTGIAGIWVKGKRTSTDENQSKDLFYSLAFAVSIKAPKGRQVSFDKNRNFIYWLKENGFNIKGISTDTFQSYDTGQTLKAKGFPYEIISVDRVDSDRINKPYQYFKSTIYEKRIEMFNQETLIQEIVELERNINTGKVDHPDGFRKDASDAVCGALYNASQHAEEFAYDYGETYDLVKEVSMPTDQRNQISIDFEKALNDTFDPLPKIKQEGEGLDFGLGKRVALTSQYIDQGIMIF